MLMLVRLWNLAVVPLRETDHFNDVASPGATLQARLKKRQEASQGALNRVLNSRYRAAYGSSPAFFLFSTPGEARRRSRLRMCSLRRNKILPSSALGAA